MVENNLKEYIKESNDRLHTKIDRLDDKLEKVRECSITHKQVSLFTKFVSGSITLLIAVIGWLCITTIDLKDVVYGHDIKISSLEETVKPLHGEYLKKKKKPKLTRVQLEIVKQHLNIRRKAQIPLRVFIDYNLKFDDPDTAGMYVLRQLDME